MSESNCRSRIQFNFNHVTIQFNTKDFSTVENSLLTFISIKYTNSLQIPSVTFEYHGYKASKECQGYRFMIAKYYRVKLLFLKGSRQSTKNYENDSNKKKGQHHDTSGTLRSSSLTSTMSIPNSRGLKIKVHQYDSDSSKSELLGTKARR